MMKFIITGIFCLLSFGHALGSEARDMLKELSIDDTSWRLISETDTSIQWFDPATQTGISFFVKSANPRFPPPHDTRRLHGDYRSEAKSYGGGLIEALAAYKNGAYYNLVTMKFPLGSFSSPPNDRPGYAYQTNLLFPLNDRRIILQVGASETGTTGIREALGIIIFMEKKGIKDLGSAADTFTRDPYDSQFDREALYNYAEQREFDASFEKHPLSTCRSVMAKLMETMTITKRIADATQFPQTANQ